MRLTQHVATAFLASGIAVLSWQKVHTIPAPEIVLPSMQENTTHLTTSSNEKQERNAELPGTTQKLNVYHHPTLGDFSAPRYQQYDQFIMQRTRFWNNHFRTKIPHYQDLDPNLVKKMLLVESGGDVHAWLHDPAQVSNAGDTALQDLRNNKIRLLGDLQKPLVRLFSEVAHAQYNNNRIVQGKRWPGWDYTNSTITPNKSIELMIPYLIASKAATYAIERDKKGHYLRWYCSGMRQWLDAAERYNGGGDPEYRKKIELFEIASPN